MTARITTAAEIWRNMLIVKMASGLISLSIMIKTSTISNIINSTTICSFTLSGSILPDKKNLGNTVLNWIQHVMLSMLLILRIVLMLKQNDFIIINTPHTLSTNSTFVMMHRN